MRGGLGCCLLLAASAFGFQPGAELPGDRGPGSERAADVADEIAGLEASLAKLEARFGPTHLRTADERARLGFLYWRQHRLPEAEAAFRTALEAYEEAGTAREVEHAWLVARLGSLLRQMARNDEALEHARRGRARLVELLGAEDRRSLSARVTEALVLRDLDRMPEAIAAAREGLSGQRRLLGEDHPELALTNLLLACLLLDQGELRDARRHCEKALQIAEAGFAPDAAIRAESLETLASINVAEGDPAAALALYDRAFAIRTRTLAPGDPVLGASLLSSARAWLAAGRPAEAQERLERALPMFERAFGSADPRVAMTLAEIGKCLTRQGRRAEACPYFERSIAIDEGRGFPDGFLTSLARANLGAARRELGRPAGALEPLERALAALEAMLGGDHPEVGGVAGELGRCCWDLGQPERAVELMLREVRIGRSYAARTLAALPEPERLAFAGRHREAVQRLVARTAGRGDLLPVETLHEEVMAWKGLVSRGLHQQRAWLQRHDDPEALARRSRLVHVLGGLTALPASAGPDSRARRRELRDEARRLERELAGAALLPGADPAAAASAWRAAAGPDTALLDFVSAEGRVWCFLAPPGPEALVAVDLGPRETLARAIEAHLRLVSGSVDGADDEAGRRLAESVGRHLRGLLWKPLAAHLANAKRVIVFPDAAVAALPFATLPGSEPGTFLIEDMEILYRQDPAASVAGPAAKAAGARRRCVLIGGVDYDRRGGEPPVEGELRPGADGAERATRSLVRPVHPLPGTLSEVRELSELLTRGRSEGSAVTLLSGASATEEALRDVCRGARIVHLATHGFFAAPEAASSSSRPGLHAIVALAGANLAPRAGDDGILTADEASWLELDGCELVVLSACETALGAARSGEPLLGMRRALRLAGARTTVTASWRVGDAATLLLMRAFYSGIVLESQDPERALRNAQLSILRDQRSRCGWARPGTWGAFIAEGG